MKDVPDHHALLYVARTVASSTVPLAYKTSSVDVVVLETARLGIDEARRLTEQASVKGLTGSGRHFVVCAGEYTVPAQNALLKLLEEPPLGVVFHIVVRDMTALVPTLLSRLYRTEESETVVRENPDWQHFCASTLRDRLLLIADKIKAKDSGWVEQVASGATTHVRVAGDPLTATAVSYVAERLRWPGASKKMLLEHLALALPHDN